MPRQPVRVQIFNQSYSLMVDGDPRDVQEIAQQVDDLMASIASRTLRWIRPGWPCSPVCISPTSSMRRRNNCNCSRISPDASLRCLKKRSAPRKSALTLGVVTIGHGPLLAEQRQSGQSA